MSEITKKRVLHNEDIETIAANRTAALTELSRLCSGERRFTMCVPVQDDDTDVLLYEALHNSERLEREVYRLRGQLKRVLIDNYDIPEHVKEPLWSILFGTGDEVNERQPDEPGA